MSTPTTTQFVFKFVLPDNTVVGYNTGIQCGIVTDKKKAKVYTGLTDAQKIEDQIAIIRENLTFRWRSVEYRTDRMWQGHINLADIKIEAEPA